MVAGAPRRSRLPSPALSTRPGRCIKYFCVSAVNSDVNRVGQSNGEAGAGRDPLRINSGEAGAGAELGQMGGAGAGHMMSPGQEHMRHGQHGQDTQGDMRQDNRYIV